MPNNFRPINRVLGLTPKLGPIPADLIVPFGVSSIVAYFSHAFAGLTPVQALFFALFLLSTWWIVTAGNSFRFVSKFSRWTIPRWHLGYRRYRSWLNAPKNHDRH